MSLALWLLGLGVLLLPRRARDRRGAGPRPDRRPGRRPGSRPGPDLDHEPARPPAPSSASPRGRPAGVGSRARRAARARADRVADRRALPAVLDLVAVALRSGAAPGPALVAAATAAPERLRAVLTDVGGLLTLGVDPARAWAGAHGSPELATVAVLAERSGTSGARLAEAFAAAAATLRDDALADGRRAAARVGVWTVLPLGTCFLPAFVCVGVVPAVVGLLAGLDTPGLG